MNVSELIAKLQKAQDQIGNEEIIIYSDGQSVGIGAVLIGGRQIVICDDIDIIQLDEPELKVV